MNPSRSRLGLACILATCELAHLAAGTTDPVALFQQGNQAYEQTNYPAAISNYLAILHTGRHSAAVHFNLGNAYFRAGQFGNAIVQFRTALLLDPRDPDVRANLRFARQAAGRADSADAPWKSAVQLVSLDEWATLASVGVAAFLITLTVQQLRPSLCRPLLPARMFLIAATLAFLTGLAASWALHRHQPTAIVTQANTAVRFGPVDASEVAFTAQDGTELTLLDQDRDWLQVGDRSGRIGWLRTNSALRFPP